MGTGRHDQSAYAETLRAQLRQNVVESRIFTIRGVEVILDRDLAEFYSVPTSRLNEQAKRNLSGYWCERGV